MSKIIACHQPNFIPYLGFFDKMMKSNIFVIRDEVLYVKKEYHNRNRIRINGGEGFKWINVPVVEVNDYIKHIKIKKDFFFKKRIWNEVLLNEIKSAYRGSEYFDEFFPEIEGIFDNSHDKLIDLNMKLINFFKKVFGIKCQVVMASDLNLKSKNYNIGGNASEDLVNICKRLGGGVYLSGSGGKGYLNLGAFDKNGIEIRFQDFKHPIYKQKFPGFIPNMASIDALFCVGGLVFEYGAVDKISEENINTRIKQEIVTIKT